MQPVHSLARIQSQYHDSRAHVQKTLSATLTWFKEMVLVVISNEHTWILSSFNWWREDTDGKNVIHEGLGQDKSLG